MSGRTLIAGIGNVFLGDDGFGVAVASRLSSQPWPEHVRILDIGIRARHLAYEILDGGYETAILVDAVQRGGQPGTVYVIEPDPNGSGRADTIASGDGHAMNPAAVLSWLQTIGPCSTRMLVVGCEPASLDECIGLSPAVSAAVDEAVTLVRELVCA